MSHTVVAAAWALAGPLIGLAATVAAATIAAAVAVIQAGRVRRRGLYSNAYRAALAWRELVYRVRRRCEGQEPELIGRFHTIQEEINYHEGWLSTECPALGVSYCRLVKTIRDVCSPLIQEAWKGPVRDFANQTNPADVHPDVADAASDFLRDAREHLSPWPWVRWRVDERNLGLGDSTWGLRAWRAIKNGSTQGGGAEGGA